MVRTKEGLPLQTPGARGSLASPRSEQLLLQQPEGILREGCQGRAGLAHRPNIPIPGPVQRTPLLVQAQPQPLTDTHLVSFANQTCVSAPCPLLTVSRECWGLSLELISSRGEGLAMN